MRNAGQQSHPFGKKKPNELGLYDMSGTVCNLYRFFECKPAINKVFRIQFDHHRISIADRFANAAIYKHMEIVQNQSKSKCKIS
jgi:formylglycine-generating enzyme required for sulfatase activity